MSKRLSRMVAANAVLVLASCLVTYMVAELALFPLFLRDLPLRFHIFLNEPARVLAQSSKRATVPAPGYVAMLGDSFAQGLGHWLITADPTRNGPFHSAHVLADMLGRDVVSLGKGGTGSAENLIGRVSDVYGVLGSAWRMRLPPPGQLVVYFYEGNDLSDNLLTLKTVVEPKAGAECWRDDACLDGALQSAYGREPQSPYRDLRQLYFGRMIAGMVVEAWEGRFRKTYVPLSFDGVTPVAPPAGTVTRVRVGGQVATLSDQLVGPSLELDDHETAQGLRVFDRSLFHLVKRFAGTPVSVVYVPSPLSSYQLVGAEVASPGRQGDARYPVARVQGRSDAVAAAVAEAAARHGAAFVDARPAVRAAALQASVHGPLDPGHFNERGYRALADAVAAHLRLGAGQ